jgi:NAD(P)-dependent dehydrogenase (short-subunit alcohol dehydrogenase family)
VTEQVLANFELDGRVAIVTGGSRGLGRAIAIGFAAAGARVVVSSRTAEACEDVVAEITDAGGSAVAVPAHVGRPDQVHALVDGAVDAFGGIDVVVNNAANPLAFPVESTTPEAFDASYRVNVRGPLLLAAAALPHLRAAAEAGGRARASVLNMITVGAFAGAEYLGLYASGKAALWNLTRTMAKEWAPLGIRVNAIAPGPFDTDMMAATLAIPEFHQQIVDSTLLRRIAEPEELLGAALLLTSDAGSYMTGSCVVVDGGLTA